MAKIKEKIKQLLNAHFILNILLAASYFILKNMPYVCEATFESCLLEWREVEILTLLVVVIAIKTRRASTFVQFVSTLCTFSKAANIILYWREGPLHVFAFGLLWFLHFVFFPQAIYKGPENVIYLRGCHLDDEIKRDERVTWLVCFYASWSPPCNDFAPAFAELSNKFAGLNNLKFAKFDCNLFPEIARAHHISTSSLSKQLPTVILFERGVETKRRPFVDSKGNVFKFVFSYENVVKEFDLNKIFYECKSRQIIVKPVAAAAAAGLLPGQNAGESKDNNKKQN
jgi:thiol-disulfide isomerase/thioredoxin